MLTEPAAALGASWLRSLPAGAQVLERDVLACTVMAVGKDWFSARVPGERRRRPLDPRLVTDEDRVLLVPGARFWWVTERVLLPGCGRPEHVSAIRFQRPGKSAESLFLPNPSSPKGAS